MFSILGYMVGFYLLYALLALCFKHKTSFITCIIIGGIIGITNIVVKQDFFSIIAIIITCILIYFIPQIQIKSIKKEKWKNSKNFNKPAKEVEIEKTDTHQLSTNTKQLEKMQSIDDEKIKDLSNVLKSFDFDMAIEDIISIKKNFDQYTKDNLPKMFKSYKENKDKESMFDMMKTFVCMYYHDKGVLLALKGKALPIINTSFGRYIAVYTSEKYLNKETFTNFNRIGFKTILNSFYTLNECNLCEGIIFNYGDENMMIVPKITFDNLQLDILFDVPWKKRNY